MLAEAHASLVVLTSVTLLCHQIDLPPTIGRASEGALTILDWNSYLNRVPAQFNNCNLSLPVHILLLFNLKLSAVANSVQHNLNFLDSEYSTVLLVAFPSREGKSLLCLGFIDN